MRAFSLDALRGYAIMTMVLSGTILSSILPAWMSHAQVPPPFGKFDPTIFGITWVDLVFPFFIFAMGAALPFSLGSKLENGISQWKLSLNSLLRSAKLTFFAIYIQHFYPWIISSPQDPTGWLSSLGAFLLMFPMFMRLPWKVPQWVRFAVEYGSFALGLTLLYTINFANERIFNPAFSNIIILVLANMALFGSLAYIFTYKNKWARIAILPFVMAIFLGSTEQGSWNEILFNYSPLPWFFKFYYLKYLFIIIPGTFAGEYLKQWLLQRNNNTSPEATISTKIKYSRLAVLILTFSIIALNLYGLFTRQLILNLGGSTILIIALHFAIKGDKINKKYWYNLFRAGSYLLLLGLAFEAYEGGIRKDSSTYSYYFVTAGLAFISLIFFSLISDIYRIKAISLPLEMAGQNPMIAYVASSMVIMPLINLLHLSNFLDLLNSNAWLGFFRGVILTTLSLALATFFTRIKWFWRT